MHLIPLLSPFSYFNFLFDLPSLQHLHLIIFHLTEFLVSFESSVFSLKDSLDSLSANQIGPNLNNMFFFHVGSTTTEVQVKLLGCRHSLAR